MAAQLPVVLALLTMAVHTPVSEGIFTFPPLPSRPPGTLPPLPCDSVLVQNNPDKYPHCRCTYRQWTDWKYITTTANTTCASNQSHTLKRTRSPLSSRCPNATRSEVKYICEPTPESKVNKLAAVLFLGPAVEETTTAPTARSTAPPASRPHTSITMRPHTALSTPRLTIWTPASRGMVKLDSKTYVSPIEELLQQDPRDVVGHGHVGNPCEAINITLQITIEFERLLEKNDYPSNSDSSYLFNYQKCSLSKWVRRYYFNNNDTRNALCQCSRLYANRSAETARACENIHNSLTCYSSHYGQQHGRRAVPIYCQHTRTSCSDDCTDDISYHTYQLCDKIEAAAQSILQAHSSDSTGRPSYKHSVTRTCPVSVEQKNICRNITEPCKQAKGYSSIAKRSTVDYTESDRVRLATLIMQQDELYKSHPDRVKRELPPANRSVLFVLDSSGSISRDAYKNVTNLLAEIALHLCGEVAVGMLTYSTHIRLHFCPTCLRDANITKAKYRQRVADWIRGVQYHGHFTLTGEVVQCLTNDLMTDPDCVFAQTKPTHIVFFTDGLDNGCQDVNRAAKELVSKHTNAEIYAIGIGNIRTSGVADLQTDPDSQTIFFNFKTIAELVRAWEVFKTNFLEPGHSRGLPVDFGTPTRYDCST